MHYQPTKELYNKKLGKATVTMCKDEFGSAAHAMDWYEDIKKLPDEPDADWMDGLLKIFGRGNYYFMYAYENAITLDSNVSKF